MTSSHLFVARYFDLKFAFFLVPYDTGSIEPGFVLYIKTSIDNGIKKSVQNTIQSADNIQKQLAEEQKIEVISRYRLSSCVYIFY